MNENPKTEYRRPKEGRNSNSEEDDMRQVSADSDFWVWREAKELNLIFGAIWRK